MRPVMVPLPRGAASRVAQIESLEEWVELCNVNATLHVLLLLLTVTTIQQ